MAFCLAHCEATMRKMSLRCPYSRHAIGLISCLAIVLGQQRPSREAGGKAITTKVIFDQNNPNFYGSSTQRMTQFPSPDNAIPFGRFAVFVGLEDEHGKILDALEPKPVSFDNLRTGYYVIPRSSGASLNAFGLVINADDPHNRHGDISYVMPCVWLSSVTWPREKILRPWVGFDSLEYSVDLRVPFANSSNIYHSHVVDDHADTERLPDFAAPYLLGGLYFEQLKRLGGNQRPPAFWIAVTLFDLRKHNVREILIVDNWSGGTNYPIVTTTAARKVFGDNGVALPDAPPRTPLQMSTPTYSFTLPDSESMLTEAGSDGTFRHFAFRVTKEHFLAAVDGIKSRMGTYTEHGRAPMSSDPSDWGLTYFNFDAEVFHHSTLPVTQPAATSRAMVVEFKNMRITQAIRSPKSLTAHGALESVDGNYVQGFACFDVAAPESLASPEQIANLRDTPVSVEIMAVDSNRRRRISLGRVSARLAIGNSAPTCSNLENGHSFRYLIPLEQITKVAEGGEPLFIAARAVLGSGKSIPLEAPPAGPLKVPTTDLENYAKGLRGHFDGVKGRAAVGWACIPGKEDAIPIDILVKARTAIQGAGALVTHGYADLGSEPIGATWDACAQKVPHTFSIDLPPTFTLGAEQTLVAVARPGNYTSPSPARPGDVQLPQADPLTNPIHLEPPIVKGYYETTKGASPDMLRIRGWACVVGSERKLRISLAGLAGSGRTVVLKNTIADRASEAAVQSECQIFNSVGDPEVRSDGKGFRFDVTLESHDMALLGAGGAADLRVQADLGMGLQPPVNIPKVPVP
jgi:hypothetical protein